jgi:hypothetical protein
MSKEAVLRSVIAAMLALPCLGLSQTYPFKLYTASDGLAQSAISTIYQDSLGRMWFGAWGGVSRYDGKRFWTQNKSTLKVLSICEGPGGTVWVRCRDFRGGRRRNPVWLYRDDRRDPAIRRSARIVSDLNGTMWIGTAKGLVVLSSDGRSLARSRILRHRYIWFCRVARRIECSSPPQKVVTCPDWRKDRGYSGAA